MKQKTYTQTHIPSEIYTKLHVKRPDKCTSKQRHKHKTNNIQKIKYEQSNQIT